MEAVTGKLILESDVVRVAEFMEREIAADRLAYVADRLPILARLIWSQERCAHLERPPMSEMHPNANESGPVAPCVGDGSAVAAGASKLK
jgi:hypothetical protein